MLNARLCSKVARRVGQQVKHVRQAKTPPKQYICVHRWLKDKYTARLTRP